MRPLFYGKLSHQAPNKFPMRASHEALWFPSGSIGVTGYWRRSPGNMGTGHSNRLIDRTGFASGRWRCLGFDYVVSEWRSSWRPSAPILIRVSE